MNLGVGIGHPSHLLTSPPEKPTVVFIPGAFHNAQSFGLLSRYLEARRCESFAIRRPSAIEEQAGMSVPGMKEDVVIIRRVLEELVWDDKHEQKDDKDDGEEQDQGEEDDDDDNANKMQNDGRTKPNKTQSRGDSNTEKPRSITRDSGGKDVVLVMHSSGAVSGCQAITNLERSHRIEEGKKGGIISLFFIGGLLVNEGETLGSTRERLGETALPVYAEVEGPILRPINAASNFYSDLPPDSAAYWSSKLQPQSASVYTAAVRDTCWQLDVPITYIRCTKDAETKVADAMVAKMRRANWTIKTIEAGHCPFLSRVKEVGDMILRAGHME